eukprot:1159585-Pelagomonas_calceolata.AAC.8
MEDSCHGKESVEEARKRWKIARFLTEEDCGGVLCCLKVTSVSIFIRSSSSLCDDDDCVDSKGYLCQSSYDHHHHHHCVLHWSGRARGRKGMPPGPQPPVPPLPLAPLSQVMLGKEGEGQGSISVVSGGCQGVLFLQRAYFYEPPI